MESKEYSWRHITADGLLSHGPCELLYACVSPGAANNNVILYDGEDATGDQIVKLQSQTRNTEPFAPPKPVYCRRGIYANLSENVDGVFVQWRELGHKGG